jgi:hypothetical protein
MFAGRFDFEHWILRDDATIVFDFHFELIVRQDSAAELKDLRETIRAQPVINIAADVRLKDNRFAPSGEAAAVDEVFHDVTNLGYMGVRRNRISIGQNKTRKRLGMLFENFSKGGEFHNRSIFLLKNIVKVPGIGPRITRRNAGRIASEAGLSMDANGEGRELTADYANDTDGEIERRGARCEPTSYPCNPRNPRFHKGGLLGVKLPPVPRVRLRRSGVDRNTK